jgi:hypothetical protein
LVLAELFNFAYARNPTHSADFRAFYAAGYLLRTHPASLYDLALQQQVQATAIPQNSIFMPFYHPSYEALLFVPLSFFSYPVAAGIFIAFSVLCLLVAFYAARPLFAERIPYLQTRPGMMLIFFLPLVGTILLGQDSVIFFALFCLMWRQLSKSKDFAGGIILGLALFRFQLAIPLAILIAARRGRRFSTGFLISGIAVTLLCLCLIGSQGIASFAHVLTHASLAVDQGTHAQMLMKVHPTQMPNLVGLLYVTITRRLRPPVALAVIAIVSLALLAWTLHRVRHTSSEWKALAMAILCAVLLSYHLLPYDLTILLPAFALLGRNDHPLLALVMYWLPVGLYLVLGGHGLFLYSIPLLGLLFYLSLVGKSADAAPLSASLPLEARHLGKRTGVWTGDDLHSFTNSKWGRLHRQGGRNRT